MENWRFRNLLKELDGELTCSDIESAKFLIRGLMQERELEKVQRGFQLFSLLEERMLLTETNLSYLAELLYRIDRQDLVNKLGYNVGQMHHALEEFHTKFDPFRVLLYKVTKDLAQNEVDALLFSLMEYIPRTRSGEIKDCISLFVILEQRNILTPSNLDALTGILQVINRQDLVSLCQRYKTFIAQKRENYTESHGAKNYSLSDNVADLVAQNSSLPVAPKDVTTSPACHMVPPGGRNKKPELERYDMSSKCKGYCVIIINEKFMDPELVERKGSQVDMMNLKYVWLKLGFKVVTYQNQTIEKMLQIMKYFAFDENHNDYNAFVCCILSHGVKDKVYGSHGKLISINALVAPFKESDKCVSLKGKPKLFFIQACQLYNQHQESPTMRKNDMEEKDGPSGNDAGDIDLQQEEQQWLGSVVLNGEADFLIGNATVPGHSAYRDINHGSWYISGLTSMLDELAPYYDLVAILTKVNYEVSQQWAMDPQKKVLKQMPSPQHTLTKQIYFTSAGTD